MTVQLCFTTAVIRKDAIAAHYPGGLAAFADAFGPFREDEALVGICSMSTGELGEIIESIASTGFDIDRHVAIGDRWPGPFETVDGIAFEKEDQPNGLSMLGDRSRRHRSERRDQEVRLRSRMS